jgi:hypothetical protein
MNKKRFSIDWNSKIMPKIKESENKKKDFTDSRIYYPQLKDDGTAETVIRFLPSPDTDIPYVKTFTHSFKGPGGWFINDCPTTLNQPCPVCKVNTEIWANNEEKQARLLVGRKGRKTNYFVNILVVKDPQNKENEGKVFLFRYGTKIHEKILQKINPPKDSVDEPIMVFDYYEGCNFKLKIKKIRSGENEYPNYDNSEWSSPSPIAKDDDEIEKIDNARFGLKEFIDPAKYKPYAELEDRYQRVVGNASSPSVGGSIDTPQNSKKNESAPVTEAKADEKEVFDGDDESFFNSLKEDSDKAE